MAVKHYLPDDCKETIEHAILHLQRALDNERMKVYFNVNKNSIPDWDQWHHDLVIAMDIIDNILMEYEEENVT